MTRVSEMAEHWFGLCRKTPTLHASPSAFTVRPVAVNAAQPGDGGASGGAGRLRRGVGIAAGSVKTLARETHLLWFSALTGLVIAFVFLAQYALAILGSYPYELISGPAGIVLTFCIEWVAIFCFCFLLAGLVLYRPAEDGGRAHTIRDGCSEAGKYLRPLLAWSGILAMAGTGIYYLFRLTGDLTINSLITRFPFGYIVEPEAYGQGPIAGTFHLMYASNATFLMMIITVVLFAITAFITPVIVLEKKTLTMAVAESVQLTKKIWGEMLVCFLILGIALVAFTTLSGLFQVLFSAVELSSPFWYEFYYKGGWGAVAALYMTAWMILALAGATVAGIAIRNLFTYAKTGRMAGSSGPGAGEQPST